MSTADEERRIVFLAERLSITTEAELDAFLASDPKTAGDEAMRARWKAAFQRVMPALRSGEAMADEVAVPAAAVADAPASVAVEPVVDATPVGDTSGQVVDKTFAFHKPSDEGLKRITMLRQQFTMAQNSILALCPASRERSVALTELETAAMWAIKAVVANDPASEVQP